MLRSQWLEDRIKQHVPKWLRQHTASQRVQPNRVCKRKQPAPECYSAIGQHLIENDQCAVNYKDDQFSILDTARILFISACSKPATIKYGDLIFANRKSLSIGYSHTVSRFARLVLSELRVTFPRSIGFANVTTASLPSETAIHIF